MYTKIALAALLLAGALGLLSCDFISSDDSLTIYADKPTYLVGEDIVVTIANRSSTTWQLLNCCVRLGYVVERRVDGDWKLVSNYACPPLCDAAPRALEPGQQLQDVVRFAEPGIYRLAGKYLDRSQESLISTVHSKPFEVRYGEFDPLGMPRR